MKLNSFTKTLSNVVVFAFLLTALSCIRQTKNIKGVSVVFDTSIKEDATSAVVSRILSAKDQPISELKFEKGTYHFYPDKAYETFAYLSNHGDLMVNTPFPLIDFHNITIDGQGSTFIFHGVMIPFLIENSSRVTVKNLSIDWNESFHSEGLVVAKDEVKKTFDMQIPDEYPYEIRNGQLFFIKEYYEHSLGQSIFYDPEQSSVAYKSNFYGGVSTKTRTKIRNNTNRINYKYETDFKAPEYKNLGVESIANIEELKPGLLRVHGHKKKLPALGLILAMKGEQGFNRVAPAFRVLQTKGFNAKNVTVHHAGGMGIIAENSSDLILDSFNVKPSKGRMVSTTADATHFVGCSGKIVLKNCTFNNQLDDASNIHGTYQKVVDILGANKIGVRMMHHQQKGFTIGRPNDILGLVRLEKSFFAYKKLTVKTIEYINNRYQIINFNEKLPEDLQVGDLVENLNGYPELLIQNCVISKNRARGLLISNPVNTIIEKNTFHTEMEAILIPVESSSWFESGNAANVIIRDNVFQDCLFGGKDRGVIRLVTDDDNRNIAFKNIEILNNIFNHYDNLILEVSNTNGLKFMGNTINSTKNFPKLYGENPAIKIKTSKNIVFKNNTYLGEARTILETDEAPDKLNFK